MRNPFCKTLTSQDFTKRNLIFFAYFFFGSQLGVIVGSFFSLYVEKLLSGLLSGFFFYYSEVKRDEQTQATELSLKNNRDVLLNSPVNF